MPGTASFSTIEPGDIDTEIAGRTARRIRDYLSDHLEDPLEIHMEGSQDEVLVVPRAGAALLAQAFAIVADGGGVYLVSSKAQLTTQQAAEMLNVSRPYLIRLLDSGVITHTKVGRHRRVAYADLMEYKRQAEQKARTAADELSDLGQEIGL